MEGHRAIAVWSVARLPCCAVRGFAWLALVLLVTSACRSNGTFIGAGDTPEPTPSRGPYEACTEPESHTNVQDRGERPGGYYLCAGPIHAAFDEGARQTVYTAHVAGAFGGQPSSVTYQWSGPNCGGWVPQESRTQQGEFDTLFSWSHPHPPCGNTTDHSDVTVKLVVSIGSSTVTCTYRGSLSGVGENCAGNGSTR